MGRLRRPELPAGRLADLVRELHALHARAGRPSMRELAKGQGFSYTAVHDMFTKTTAEPPRLPVLLKVVQRLATIAPRMNVEETLDRFDELWRAADTEPFQQPATAVVPTIEILPSEKLATVVGAERGPAELAADEESVLEPVPRAAEPPDMGRAMTTELFFLANDAAPLHDAAAELRRAGYLVRCQPRHRDGRWLLRPGP